MPHPRSSATTRDLLRRTNLEAIFGAIHRDGPVSRTQLVAATGLSAATITSLTAELIQAGLIYEAEEGVSTRAGRKPILLQVDYDRTHVVGVKLSSESITAAVTNLRAEIRAAASTPLPDRSPTAVARAIADHVRAVCASASVPLDGLAGLCLSLPGIVDSATGRVRSSPLPSWSEAPLAAWVEAQLGVPVMAENDVNALAVAEAWFGAGHEHSDFLVVTLGRGVGLGIVLNGQVYRGPRGGAGEFGHVALARRPDGTVETVEDLLSDAAVVARAAGRIAPVDAPATLAELVAMADAGHATALEVLAAAGDDLGLALSTLVNLFAPTLVVLGGEGVDAARYLMPAAREALREHSFGDLADDLEIVVEPWGDDAWARGAAGLAASRYLATAGLEEVIQPSDR